MRKSHLVLLAIIASFLLGWTLRPIAVPSEAPRITGVGGIFFKCQDPVKLKAWYAEHFGMKMDQYGTLFEFRSAEDPSVKGHLQWSAFGPRSSYFRPGNKDFMVNYRVTGIGEIMKHLRASGATIKDSTGDAYGIFVHVLDPDSTLIELWQPVDSVVTKDNEGKTTH